MRSKAIIVVLALNTVLALWAATPAKKKTGAKKATAKTSAVKGSKSKGAKTAFGKKASGKKSTTAKNASARYRRSTQREPAPERYREIQQSLADKGYFAGPVNGAWGADSVDALKRFQRDQNIGDDGKLGSLSLIALGLGPKRGASEPGAGEKPANPQTGGPTPP